MNMVLSHNSALEYWRSVRIGKRTYGDVLRAKYLIAVPPNKRDLADTSAWWLSRPLHVLVAHATERRSSKEIVSHVWKGALPKGAILDTRHGFCVCTPEMLFLQMASALSLIELIELGYELCGTYDVSEKIRPCEPLTTVARIEKLVTSVPNVHGRKRALGALRYINDNSNSPMETLLAMLLCLPYRLGGYGFPGPTLNARIDIPVHVRRVASKGYYVCDMYWAKYRLAVEYDSAHYHTAPDNIASDSEKRNALEAMGVRVVSATSRQVASGRGMNKLAHSIARSMGRQLRYKDPEFTRTFMALQNALLHDLLSGNRSVDLDDLDNSDRQ